MFVNHLTFSISELQGLISSLDTRNIELMRESQTMQFTGTVATDEDLCWSPGDPVIAMFHLDKKWYRATVLQASFKLHLLM